MACLQSCGGQTRPPMPAPTERGSATPAFKHTHINLHHLSLSPTHTHPVFCLPGSPFQALLELRAQSSGPAELLHHPPCVAQFFGGQQRLQGLQVAAQGLGQRGHRLRRHRGEETHFLRLWNTHTRFFKE